MSGIQRNESTGIVNLVHRVTILRPNSLSSLPTQCKFHISRTNTVYCCFYIMYFISRQIESTYIPFLKYHNLY